MPDMYEIYQHHADRYDALVSAEDADGNLGKVLDELVNWNEAQVLEAGVGTGRITSYYIDRVAHATLCDRSTHMMAVAEERFLTRADKLSFVPADNFALPGLSQPADVFVEGWSFGHTISDHPGSVRRTTLRLMHEVERSLRPGGVALIIETLGTNCDEPAPPSEALASFYQTLERSHGFKRREISNDFLFSSTEEAADALGFFFGEEMRQAVLTRGTSRVPSWTGVWWRRF